jgi:glycosyltransferase involved in cell wall biosynthesis
MSSKMNRKRVDVVTKYFFPVSAGIEQNILQTYKVLQRDHGWEVTVHTSANTYLEKNSLEPETYVEGLRVKRYKTGHFGFFPSIDWNRTDVVALHNFDVFFFRFFLKFLWDKLLGKKTYATILTPHGGFNPEWSIFPPIIRIVKKIYTYSIGSLLINLTIDGVRAVSEWERSVMLKYLKPNLVRAIDNGLEDEAYIDVEKHASEYIKATCREWGKYIIQVARVYAIKNMETAIRALARLPPDIRYVIVGQLQDKTYLDKLNALARQLGVAERVIYAGVIRGVDKYYVMKHAVAMIHMALWESYGNVLREAMSQGTPCVVSNVYNIPFLVKDGINGFCLPVHDDASAAAKIMWILDPANTSAIQKIRNANIDLGKNQSWRDVAKNMSAFYTACLSQYRL